jgi:hypothetical protein
MCPACLTSAAMMIASMMSMGGLTVLVMKKLDSKIGAKKSIQNQTQKEETWEK